MTGNVQRSHGSQQQQAAFAALRAASLFGQHESETRGVTVLSVSPQCYGACIVKPQTAPNTSVSAGSTRRGRRGLRSCRVCRTRRGITSRMLAPVKNGGHFSRQCSRLHLESRATVGRQQRNWKTKSRPCRQGRKEEAVVRHSPIDVALTQPCFFGRWSRSSHAAQTEHFIQVMQRVIALKETSCRWRWWRTWSRGRTKQCPLWSKEKRRCRNGTSRSCRRCYLVIVEEGCQEEALRKKAGKKGKPDGCRKERKIRSEIPQEVVADIKEEASAQEDAKSTAQRTVGQRVKPNCDCSQVEHEEEDDEEFWQMENQMEGRKMRSWRRCWNKEGWKEALCRRKSCNRYQS